MLWLLSSLFGDQDFAGIRDFRRSLQLDRHSCGPCSVQMVARHFGLNLSLAEVREGVGCTPRRGTNESKVCRYLDSLGFQFRARYGLSFAQLKSVVRRRRPVIVCLDGDHYGVVHGFDANGVYLADPALWLQFGRWVSNRRFLERWAGEGIIIDGRRRRSGR